MITIDKETLEQIFEDFRNMVVYVEDEVLERFGGEDGDDELSEDVRSANNSLDKLYDILH